MYQAPYFCQALLQGQSITSTKAKSVHLGKGLSRHTAGFRMKGKLLLDYHSSDAKPQNMCPNHKLAPVEVCDGLVLCDVVIPSILKIIK